MADRPHRPVALRDVAAVDMPTRTRLRALYRDFGQDEIDWLAEQEAVTRHDVKAIEYLVRDRLSTLGLDAIAELTHFACTSEDINSARLRAHRASAPSSASGCRLSTAVIAKLRELAVEHRDAADAFAHARAARDAHDHGQGDRRVRVAPGARRARRSRHPTTSAKFSGATGTWSAHLAADPDVDWPTHRRASSSRRSGLGFNLLTTQIESHDWQVELYDRARHAGGILHNLATDIWTYISLGYFAQIPVAGATGSSTMPHKINPIRFENAEANLEIVGRACSRSLVADARHEPPAARPHRLDHAAQHRRRVRPLAARARQPAPRARRDLARARRAARPTSTPTGRCSPRPSRPSSAPRSSPVARTITDPYALLKELTRGRRVGAADLAEFVRGLDIGDAAQGATARPDARDLHGPRRKPRRRSSDAFCDPAAAGTWLSSRGLRTARRAPRPRSRPGLGNARARPRPGRRRLGAASVAFVTRSGSRPLGSSTGRSSGLRDLGRVDGEQQQRDDDEHHDERRFPRRCRRRRVRAIDCSRSCGWKKPIDMSVTMTGEEGGDEGEPQQLHGLHQIAAGGSVVAHATPRPAQGAGASVFVSVVPSGTEADGAASARRGEKPAIARYTAVIAAYAAEDADADDDAGQDERLVRLIDVIVAARTGPARRASAMPSTMPSTPIVIASRASRALLRGTALARGTAREPPDTRLGEPGDDAPGDDDDEEQLGVCAGPGRRRPCPRSGRARRGRRRRGAPRGRRATHRRAGRVPSRSRIR